MENQKLLSANTSIKIKLTQDPYVSSANLPYYTPHVDSDVYGADTTPYYTAHAIDDNGGEYDVIWSISNHEAFEIGDEDCCTWDVPDVVYSYKEGKIVDAVIV